jgi:Protein of unknown function (DUF2589)
MRTVANSISILSIPFLQEITMATAKTPARRAASATRTSSARTAASPAAANLTAGDAARLLAATAGRVTAAAVGARKPVVARIATTDPNNLITELNNIDFRKMIGGPLQAAVDAQVASSLATVDFIQKVGFKDVKDGQGNVTGRELVMVNFTHERTGVDDKGNATPAKKVGISVPLLAMLPIPSLRIEHVIIDFNVKLNSVENTSVSDELGVNAEVTAGWGPVKLKVSASYQRKTATNVEVKKEYSLNVNVKAVQDEIPAGLEKILNMLAA